MRASVKQKRTLVTDSEVYKNYCLIGFMDIATDAVWSIEAVGAESRFSKEDRAWLARKMKRELTVGFNSRGFDLVLYYAAIAGLTVAEMKQIADEIIVGKKNKSGEFIQQKSWDVEKAWGIEIPRNLDTIDLIEVAPGKASLKIYNGRVHGRRMQDLPIDPNSVLTDDEIERTYEYWKNDLQATKVLYLSLAEQIALRTALSKEYGIDLRSKSDAQVAEAVIKKRVEQITGSAPHKPDLSKIKPFKYRAPDYIRFKSEHLNDVLETIEAWDFRLSYSGKVQMPDFLSSAEISFEQMGETIGHLNEDEDEEREGNLKVGGSVYRMGIGGLHSSEKRAVHTSDDEFVLIDADVASYYPSIILNLGLYPETMGKAFLKVYRGIVERRLAAKAKQGEIGKEIEALKAKIASANRPSELMADRLVELEADFHREKVANEGGKIMINGSFGKLGSRWSALFSPNLLITVTLTGQLALLMLIEWLEAAGISVVSGNTDGILIKCPRGKLDRMQRIIGDWQDETGFIMETGEYKAVYSRDVNNYIALKPDGKAKRKGAYAKSGLEEKKNPSMDICADAVAEFLSKGTPITKSIRECQDIRKFVTVRTVKGGAIWNVSEVEVERIGKRGQKLKPGVRFDDSEAEYLGKAIRWYQSTCGNGAIHYKGSLNRVPKSDGAAPLMELPDTMPEDVDFSWYVREARRMLYDIGYYEDL